MTNERDPELTKVKSDDYRTFQSGAIRDSDVGKEDYVETLAWTALKRYAQYMTAKKAKYGAGNFKKGIPVSSYEESLARHVQKYFANKYEDAEDEPGEDHLSAIVFNVFGIMYEVERSRKRGQQEIAKNREA